MYLATKQTTSYMLLSSILALILGMVMLLYPGGTMKLMNAAFWMLQAIITFFILVYTISAAVGAFSASSVAKGVVYLIIGILATALIWLFDVSFIFTIIALFLMLTGIFEITTGFKIPTSGRYFFIFLGIVNVMVGALIVKYPLIVPLIIAWYVFFWGVSRLFLTLELRKMT